MAGQGGRLVVVVHKKVSALKDQDFYSTHYVPAKTIVRIPGLIGWLAAPKKGHLPVLAPRCLDCYFLSEVGVCQSDGPVVEVFGVNNVTGNA